VWGEFRTVNWGEGGYRKMKGTQSRQQRVVGSGRDPPIQGEADIPRANK